MSASARPCSKDSNDEPIEADREVNVRRGSDCDASLDSEFCGVRIVNRFRFVFRKRPRFTRGHERHRLTIVAGATSSQKRVLIEGLTLAELLERLGE